MYLFKPKIWVILLACSLLYSTSSQANNNHALFQEWLKKYTLELSKKTFDQGFLKYAFKNVKYDDEVIRLDRYQPEFRLSFRDYLERRLTKNRIANAKYHHQKHLGKLQKLEAKYGVPPEIIIAIWSLETNHGTITGNRYIIQSLATLAFDGRRNTFFTKELETALQLMKKHNIDRQKFNGSWAGAMGHPQFMPSTYLYYAIDGDKDGKINLWDSLDDVFHSASNYLKRMRWDKQSRWGMPVKLGDKIDLSKLSLNKRLPAQQWARMGVNTLDGKTFEQRHKASIILTAGFDGPAFMIFNNFRSILRWNNSSFYALSVGILSDLITDRLKNLADLNLEAIERNIPSLQQIKDLQTLLNEKGYNAGKPDGIIGPNTKQAITRYQKDSNLTPDGYADFTLLKHMKIKSNKN